MRLLATLLILATLLALVAAAGGCSRESGANAADAPTPAIDRVVAGQPIRKTLVLATTQPARIEAFEITPLFAKLAGYVGEVRVDIGDTVKKGQPLVLLNMPELENEVAQKEALVKQGEAEVKQAEAVAAAARAAAETAAAQITEVQAGVGGAEADAQRWSAEHNRIKQLASSGSVTQKLVDETASQLAAAQAAHSKAVAAVASAEAGAREATALIAKAEADHAAAEARLGVARADLARAKTMLGYATLAAPFDGVVTERSVDTGHFVQPGGGASRPLVTVARTDKFRVSIDIPELEAGHVDLRDPVALNVQAFGGGPISATVTRTSWSLDPANRSLRTEADLTNDDARLRPGLYAVATVELARRENALSLPNTAIIRDGQRAFVNEVRSGRIVRRSIKLGLRSGSDVEIVEGLDETAIVVLVRGESLSDGQTVEVIKPQG
jgi:RND family efflux transporter MFP subunit